MTVSTFGDDDTRATAGLVSGRLGEADEGGGAAGGGEAGWTERGAEPESGGWPPAYAKEQGPRHRRVAAETTRIRERDTIAEHLFRTFETFGNSDRKIVELQIGCWAVTFLSLLTTMPPGSCGRPGWTLRPRDRLFQSLQRRRPLPFNPDAPTLLRL